jgi:hypothetical protein
MDEWYGQENYMYASCMKDFLEWKGEGKIAEKFKEFMLGV